jgi:ubiquinone biosynthesis protein COQ4
MSPEAPWETPSPPPPRRVQWRRARTALRTLVRDPERTEQVFELIQALAGSSGERVYQRFCADPEGRRLLGERPSLLAALADGERLAALPGTSFGRAYADFMREERLEAAGLVDAAAAVRERGEDLDPERRWFFDRLRDMHDLWHVLTGYGRDVAGEAANLAFTYGVTRNRGIGVIVLTAAVRGPKAHGLRWQRYLLRAWQRGRRARRLTLASYEELLAQPLSEVRRGLGVEPPEVAHPGGVIVFGGEAPAAP